MLNPGAGVHHYEKIFYFGGSAQSDASYTILGDDGKPLPAPPPAGVFTFSASMSMDGFNEPYSWCGTTIGACTPGSTPTINAHDIALYDDPGTVHDLPASRAQVQAEALRSFCAQSNTATCHFTATSEIQVDSPTHPVGNALINDTDEEQETRVTIEDKVGSSDSVEVGVKVGGEIAELLDVEVSAKYDHEWTTEHTFSQDVTVHCPAHHKCWIDAVAPMYRDTGNFTVTLGNTTWNLTGCTSTAPTPHGRAPTASRNARVRTTRRRATSGPRARAAGHRPRQGARRAPSARGRCSQGPTGCRISSL